MNSKTKSLLIAAVVAIIAFGGNKLYLDSQRAQLAPKEWVTVAVAKRDIKAGTKLTQQLYDAEEVPRKYAPRTAIKISEIQGFLGQDVNVNVPSRDYLLDSFFRAEAAAGNKLSDSLEPGSRAVTIPVDEINSLSRSLVAGDRIDILFTFTVPGAPGKMSVVFMENLPVISTGSYSAADQELGQQGAGRRYSTVTLMLPVRDAVRLNYARQSGQINILLRSSRDSAGGNVPPITGVPDLLAAADRQTVEEAARRMAAPQAEMSEQVKEQFRQLLDQQRTQAGQPRR